ncbi:phage holin family protein [Oceaniglobus ichthyenteri]|uniref:phage holin family protein n=1 Tax=Oceaniglobus ichthyenteri TaxID=2136177 RepID=UPI000D3340D9|nr:phage holin family protein [Oceaniglobus ichthyenteri]
MLTLWIERAKDAARRTAFGAAGFLCLVVGLGFLSSALWLAIAVANGAMMASLILGLLYVGGGLILIAVASRRPRRYAPPPSPKAVKQADLITAFMNGVNAGKTMRR